MVRCPECGSHHVAILSRETLTSGDCRIAYKCLDCGYSWIV